MYRRLRNLREDHDYTQRYIAEILNGVNYIGATNRNKGYYNLLV